MASDDMMMTTLAIGEEDGPPDCDVDDLPKGRGKGWDDDDWGWATTMALGEEGDPGDPGPIEVTTLAVGEECDPGYPEPIEATTMALGEEGDDGYDFLM